MLQDRIFGCKADKVQRHDGQLSLFDIPEPPSLPEDAEQIEIPSHSRKKKGRRQLPGHLPRIEGIHDLPEEEKKCACGHEKTRMGEEVSEQLDYIPAKVQVIRHIRIKYACKKYIIRLYKIEKEAREHHLSSDDLYRERQQKALPILKEFKQWLNAKVGAGTSKKSSWKGHPLYPERMAQADPIYAKRL